MRHHSLRIMKFWVFVSIFVLSGASLIFAEYAKKGWYGRLIFPIYSLRGSDFDGETSLSNGFLILVPKVETGSGFGLTFGKSLGIGEIELSYLRTTHASSFFESGGDSSIWIADLNLKVHFLKEKSIQPYALLGMGYSILTAKDFSMTLYETVNRNSDASFKGLGFSGGAGIAFYIHPKVSIDGELIFRFMWFDSAKTPYEEWWEIGVPMFGFGLNFIVGITYTF